MNSQTLFSSDERYFLLRRLHSLSGILPIGAFFLEHIYSNSKAVNGALAYNQMVEDLMSIPFLPFIEIGVIALPILFHAILGIVIWWSSKSNATHHRYFNNWRYTFQRVTGFIALFYIGYHVWKTRIHGLIIDEHVTFQRMQDILSTPFNFWFYLIGVLSVTYHFTNGIWTFLISWGITISPRSQKISAYSCLGLFLLLMAVWIKILYTFNSNFGF